MGKLGFIQLNGRKVILRLMIQLSIYSIIAFIFYGVMKKHGNAPGDTPIMLIFGEVNEKKPRSGMYMRAGKNKIR